MVMTHSFCASMMIKVLSLGLAVEGGAPSISRIDLTCVADDIVSMGIWTVLLPRKFCRYEKPKERHF
jgi:hypothetical protein